MVLEGVGDARSAPRAARCTRLPRCRRSPSTGKPETAVDPGADRFRRARSDCRRRWRLPTPGIHVINQIYALIDAGRPRDAVALATAAYQSLAAGERATGRRDVADAPSRVAHALLLGEAATARRWLGEAVARCNEYNLRRTAPAGALAARDRARLAR